MFGLCNPHVGVTRGFRANRCVPIYIEICETMASILISSSHLKAPSNAYPEFAIAWASRLESHSARKQSLDRSERVLGSIRVIMQLMIDGDEGSVPIEGSVPVETLPACVSVREATCVTALRHWYGMVLG